MYMSEPELLKSVKEQINIQKNLMVLIENI